MAPLECMNNQRTTSTLKIGLARCHAKSPTAQDAFWPMPGHCLSPAHMPSMEELLCMGY